MRGRSDAIPVAWAVSLAVAVALLASTSDWRLTTCCSLVARSAAVYELPRSVTGVPLTRCLAVPAISCWAAAEAFADPYSVDFSDALWPDRLVTLAMSGLDGILCVVTVERGPRIRIISARRASSHEHRIYKEDP